MAQTITTSINKRFGTAIEDKTNFQTNIQQAPHNYFMSSRRERFVIQPRNVTSYFGTPICRTIFKQLMHISFSLIP